MKFSDIKMLTACGSYNVNTPLDSLAVTIERYQRADSCTPGLGLLPDFQRGHVWTRAQQIAYVEFFLRGGMTGRTIYFNCPNWGHFRPIPDGQYRDFVIVDGLQRLTALLAFVRGELPAFKYYMRPKGMENSEVVDNKEFFEDRVIHSAANSNLIININNLKRREDVLRWYLEMNSGGTPHTQAELDKVRGLIEVERGKKS